MSSDHEGMTRREALRRGTLAGLGLVWVSPRIYTVRMSAEFAQATSGVTESTTTTRPGDTTTTDHSTTTTVESTSTSADATTTTVESTSTSTDETTTTVKSTSTSVGNTSTSVGGTSTSGQTPTTPGVGNSSTSVDVESSSTGGSATTTPSQPEDEILGTQLPFTGLALEQLLPLAGGAVATGAAVVRLAKDRKSETLDQEGSD